nr:SEC12-like protein 2 [Ipomoea batatas]
MANDESCKKYGVPVYGAAWVPPGAIRSAPKPPPEGDGDDKDAADKSPPVASHNYVVMAGGGGEGNSGIPNAILLARFDFDSNFLSDLPVARLGTGSDLPYRMTVHPGGEGLICSLPKSCSWFEWDAGSDTDDGALSVKSSERLLKQLEDVGQQLALTFNNEGSLLAVGEQDGKLRVFKWPSMEIIIDEANAHSCVKDLDFSPDGKFLVSAGSGPCRVWNVSTSASVASLQKENDEVLGFCRFSRSSDNNQALYATAMQGKGGSIVKWSTASWNRMSSKWVSRDPISAFNVSADGKLLAIGTIQGDVLILSSNLRVLTTVKKAHLGLVTTLKFSDDSRALLSTSLDSSVRVTVIKDKSNEKGFNLWIILFILLMAIAVYYANREGKLSLPLDFPIKF